MSEARKVKLCPSCYEAMDERARRCPHCLRWQTKSALLFGSPWLRFLLLMLLACWFPLLVIRAALRPLWPFEGYALYDGQIEVIESQMLFGESKEGPVVFVVGRLRNNSDVTWKDMHVEAVFLDESGSLVNVETQWQYGRHIAPRGESAFKVRGLADLPRERYAKHKVTVTGAEDARRWP